MGIGAERVLTTAIGGHFDRFAHGLEAAFKNPGPSIAGFVSLAKSQKGLIGFGSDIEARGSPLDFTCYLAKLRAALRPLGVRVTMYNNAFVSHDACTFAALLCVCMPTHPCLPLRVVLESSTVSYPLLCGARSDMHLI